MLLQKHMSSLSEIDLNMDYEQYRKTDSRPTTKNFEPPVTENVYTKQKSFILIGVAIAFVFVLSIIGLVLAGLSYSHSTGGFNAEGVLTAAEKATLLALSTKVGFDGNTLIAQGFSDNSALLQNAAAVPFLATGGTVTCETIGVAGVVTCATISATGSATAGDVTCETISVAGSATVGDVTCANLTTAGAIVSQSVQTDTFQTNTFAIDLLSMEDTKDDSKTSLIAGSLTLTGPEGQSVLSSTGLSFDTQNLVGLRYLASGMSTIVTTNGGKLAPLSAMTTYRTMFIPASDIKVGSTFRVWGQGVFDNDTATHIQIVLANGTSYTPQSQVFIGDSLGQLRMYVPSGGVTQNPTFMFDYLVTMNELLIDGTARTSASGTVTFSEIDGVTAQTIIISDHYPLSGNTNGITIASGINFSVWLVINGGALALIPQRITVTQIL